MQGNAANAQSVAKLEAHALLAFIGGEPTDGAALTFGEGDPLLDAALVEGVENVLALEGEVGLELQNDGRLLEAAKLARCRYVVDDAAVGGADVLGAQSFGAEHLGPE